VTKSIKERTDEELLAAHQTTEDPSYFRELYERYYPMIRAVAGRLLNGSAIANEVEDAIQEVFLELHRTRDHFRHGLRVKPWLHTIAQRKCVSYARHQTRKTYFRKNCGLGPESEPTISAAPDVRAERLELEAAVREHLNSLPDNEREVLEHLYFFGKTIEAAAEQLGTCLATIKNRARRGRDKLKQRLPCPV
jgi:RNA polymerase sigma-70 factor, ECF subfamily